METPITDVGVDTRPFCYRCHKPRLTCICASVTRVNNRTPVWILQHPRERFHPIGTARIAHLGLEQVVVDVRRHDRPGPPPGFPTDAALLYPGTDARDLLALSDAPPSALVVLDGTWPHARSLFRDHRWLHGLPRFGLVPPEPSRYRIRKEPAPQCVSTIESLVYALSIIEPDTPGLDGLLDAFRDMIDEQIRICRTRRSGKRRATKPARLPLGVDRDRLVLVEAEAIGIAGDPERRRELVHWVAWRVGTGEAFDRVVRPRDPPASIHHRYMGLSHEEVSEGTLPRRLEHAWRDFTRVDDVVCAWTQDALDVRPLPERLPTRLLKSAYCNVRRDRRGSLEQMVSSEALEPAVLPLRGRAGRRVAAALAMYELLCARAQAQI